MEKEREEIMQWIIDTEVVERSIKYQCRGISEYYAEELRQEIYLWLLTYKFEKLYDAWHFKHINALITGYIRRQWHSGTSQFYLRYKRWDWNTDEIGQEQYEIPDEGEYQV